MIVRTGNRSSTDLGPAPANVSGLYAINTIALVSEVSVSPVERRYLSREELAAIHEADARLDLPPVPTITPAERREATVKARKRGGDSAAAARYAERCDAVWDALRASAGNVTAAAVLLGRDRSRVRYAILRKTPPADVAALLAAPARRKSGWASGDHRHTPETRALIAIRVREYHARKRAA